MNLKRKIKRARKIGTLQRYTRQLDQWLEELRLANRPVHRHSYVYDMFEERLRASPLQGRGHSKYLRG